MTLSAGVNRLDLVPINELGERRAGVRGSHLGPASGLNIQGAQPGMVYKWIRHPKHDRGGAQLQRFVNMGYEVVPPGDPEYKDREASLQYSQLGVDGYQVHGDVLLVRIPEEKERERQEFRTLQNQIAMTGGADEYLSRGEDLSNRYGLTDRAEGPIYYKGPGHGLS